MGDLPARQVIGPLSCTRLFLWIGTGIDNGRLEVELDLTGARASGLEFLDDLHALGIGDLTKDDVLAIQPRGDDGGDEELGSVAVVQSVSKTIYPKEF